MGWRWHYYPNGARGVLTESFSAPFRLKREVWNRFGSNSSCNQGSMTTLPMLEINTQVLSALLRCLAVKQAWGVGTLKHLS